MSNTRQDKIKNTYIREKIAAACTVEKMDKSRVRWFALGLYEEDLEEHF